MKCPKCNHGTCKYDVQRKKKGSRKNNPMLPRKDFHASCKKCSWKGEI